MEECKYYNEFIRCYRNGKVERFYRNCYWKVVENTDNNKGYNCISINGKMILRHRIIAYCFLGLEDIVGKKNLDNSIDHLNGNRTDNRVDNLRITTNQGNSQNRKNTKGYTWNKQRNKWKAQIYTDKKKIFLGRFNTEQEARQAYLTAKAKYHIV